MVAVLHILTRPDDPLASAIISRQKQQPETRVKVMDLTQADPDYTALLEEIFAADSVQVW